MAHARSTESGHALEVAVGRHEVDGDRISLAGNRQRGGLTDLADELLEVGTGEVTEVESAEHRVRIAQRANPSR